MLCYAYNMFVVEHAVGDVGLRDSLHSLSGKHLQRPYRIPHDIMSNNPRTRSRNLLQLSDDEINFNRVTPCKL